MQTTVSSQRSVVPRRAHRFDEEILDQSPEPPSQPVSRATWLAIIGFSLIVISLIAAIILGPKSMPEPVNAAPALRRVNPSIIMTTMTPSPTPLPTPTPTATPLPARLMVSGLAGEADLPDMSISCAKGICDNIESSFVWVCWSGRVVESTTRLYQFLTLSNLPGCIKAARVDNAVARNQAFGISSNVWTALAGSMPGFKLLVLELYDVDYPAPFDVYSPSIPDPERPAKASPPG